MPQKANPSKNVSAAATPRLRFDKTAIGLVKRLQTALTKSIPDGQTVVVTITAPIRQDSQTGAILIQKIQSLLAAGKLQLRTTIHQNQIRVQVLPGGNRRTAKLIGFVHNPEPNPAILFKVTQSLLHCISPNKALPTEARWLATANLNNLASEETVRQIILALHGQTRRSPKSTLASSDTPVSAQSVKSRG